MKILGLLGLLLVVSSLSIYWIEFLKMITTPHKEPNLNIWWHLVYPYCASVLGMFFMGLAGWIPL
jgi:hypothetical protein